MVDLIDFESSKISDWFAVMNLFCIHLEFKTFVEEK